MSEQFLYRKLETLEEVGALVQIPEYINANLNENINLREYQERAISYFLTYYESENLRKNKQVHNLFHMATGSGKTVIMAGLMLFLYQKGYRKFLFFVNQNNIIEKTKENFLNPSSIKYLFNDNIEIDGKSVAIQEVENFAYYNKDAINICFTSTQKLHFDLNFPKENAPTFEDFEDDQIVLISDESHHINTVTKSMGSKQKAEVEENTRSWEYTINRIFSSNIGNVLLEFTATADLEDPNVKSKYTDKIVFDYTLSKFRESGYTKDFQNMQGDYDRWTRSLLAIVISEYRRHLFGDAGKNVKPVVLMKSDTIKASEAEYEEFFRNLNKLEAEQIKVFVDSDNEFLRNAINYFIEKDPSLASLIADLKMGFARENSLILNSKSEADNKAKQIAVNSLEDLDNPYRIIFTVDMLNEGWDVLNLFDIVRLYEKRDGKNGQPGKTTISEAQLIGRGARYFPFQMQEDQPKYKRKYDYDADNENRILETLLYHSMQDSRYIGELRNALKQSGLLPSKLVEINYVVKESFKDTDFFKNALIFSNRKVEKSRDQVNEVDKKIQNSYYTYRTSSNQSVLYSLFEENEANRKQLKKIKPIKIKNMPLNIVDGTMNRFESLKFNILKSYFPQLRSRSEFIKSDKYLGNITIQFETYENMITARDYQNALVKVFQDISTYIQRIETEYEGTREFYPKRAYEVIRDKKIYLDNPKGDGQGISQSLVKESNLELGYEEWYVYEDNFGTTEEKSFIFYFKSIVSEFKDEYDEVYLVRNERLSDLAIYDFDTGERFEPDYLLFLQKKGTVGYTQEQIYIEPKGDHLLGIDKWKEDFLLRIEQEGIPVKKYVDDNSYRIFGLPFYNQNYRKNEFDEDLRKIL